MAGAATAVACLELVSKIGLKIGLSVIWSYLLLGWLGAFTGEVTSLAAVVACLRQRVSILFETCMVDLNIPECLCWGSHEPGERSRHL
jgi:hypothetical protein